MVVVDIVCVEEGVLDGFGFLGKDVFEVDCGYEGVGVECGGDVEDVGLWVVGVDEVG